MPTFTPSMHISNNVVALISDGVCTIVFRTTLVVESIELLFGEQ